MPLTPSALDLALNRCASAESATGPPGPDLGPLAAVAAGPSDSQLGLSPAQLNRRRTEEDKRLAQDLLRSRRVRGSYTVSLAALLVCLISLPFCLYVGLRFQSRLGLSLIGLTMAAAAYEGVMLILLRCGRHRPWLDWVNVSLEVSVVSGAVLLDAHYLGPAYAFTSAPLLLYR